MTILDIAIVNVAATGPRRYVYAPFRAGPALTAAAGAFVTEQNAANEQRC
jgi:hypothetical protein